MNKVIVSGRPTRDPEVRNSSTGITVAKFTLAVNRRQKKEGEQDADFFGCTAFGKTAEFIEKYVKQGTKLEIEGRLQSGSYVNKDNVRVYTTDIIVESAEFAESKAVANQNAKGASKNYNNSDIPEDLPFN